MGVEAVEIARKHGRVGLNHHRRILHRGVRSRVHRRRSRGRAVKEVHEVNRSRVDVSGSKDHEIAQNVVTVLVHTWCKCGRHVQGTFKVPVDKVDDDDVMKDAILRAEEKSKEYFTYHLSERGLRQA